VKPGGPGLIYIFDTHRHFRYELRATIIGDPARNILSMVCLQQRWAVFEPLYIPTRVIR
jgi:hypothetical protein